MTDLLILKNTFLKLKLDFYSAPNLDGYTVIIQTKEKEITFEFNENETFIGIR